MKYAINGRFLTQRVTGVQRFEREIVRALDEIANVEDICLVVPPNYDKNYKLRRLRIIIVGKTSGIFWEQTSFLFYLMANRLTGINLGNVAPLLKPDVVCIHDVKLVINPEWFNWRYVVWSKLNYWNALNRGKLVLTVSNFSKAEIERVYPQKKVNIGVLDEGWQHMDDIVTDNNTMARYQLLPKQFYFSLYQSIPNKNFQWIMDAAKKNPDENFVISGWSNKKTSSHRLNSMECKNISNIKILGFITDEEMKCLMENCKAFIFPSLYEGFGLPPLEALSVGAHVMVMGIPVMKEVFCEGVQYLKNEEHDLNPIVVDDKKINNVILMHSWSNGARTLVEYLNNLY